MKTKLKSIFILSVAIFVLPLSFSAFSQTSRPVAGFGRSEYIEVEPKVNLHITDLGEGKPVVLIHGWPLSDAMYEYQYAALVQKGFRVIGITLRGYGLSDKPYGRYDLDVFADDIKVVLEKLKIQNATLGGFSLGGAVVIHFMAKYNGAHVKKIALFGAAAPVFIQQPDFSYSHWTKEDVNGLIALNNSDRPQLLENFAKIFTANDSSLSPGYAAWLRTMEWQASPYAMEKTTIALRDADLRADLKKITAPTLILHGKEDKICAFPLAEQMQRLLPDAVLIPFEKSGHALFLEERDKFNRELIRFIEKES